MPTDAEILANFREFQARQSARPSVFTPLRNDPHHVGVVDANYVRPLPSEFPKVVYRKSADGTSSVARIVASQAEQDALPPSWAVTTEQIHALLESIIKKEAEQPAAEEAAVPATTPAKATKKK